MIEAAGGDVERPAGRDEVQEVVAARALEEEHPPVRERDPEAEDVHVEALRRAEVPAPQGDVAKAAGAGRPSRRPGHGGADHTTVPLPSARARAAP